MDHFAAALAAAQRATDVQGAFIVAVDRTCGLAQAERSVAAAERSDAVAAVGLANDERSGPLAVYAPVLRSTRLPVVPHAGELLGPEEVVYAACDLSAHRIGHGTSAGADPTLLAALAESGVGLEACLTSNDLLGVVPVDRHPLPHWLAAGIAVSLHADDPVLMGTTLLGEYLQAQQTFSLTAADVATLARNAWRTSFAPPDLVAAALSGIETWERRWQPSLDRPV